MYAGTTVGAGLVSARLCVAIRCHKTGRHKACPYKTQNRIAAQPETPPSQSDFRLCDK